jgi:hypothetical protein
MFAYDISKKAVTRLRSFALVKKANKKTKFNKAQPASVVK